MQPATAQPDRAIALGAIRRSGFLWAEIEDLDTKAPAVIHQLGGELKLIAQDAHNRLVINPAMARVVKEGAEELD